MLHIGGVLLEVDQRRFGLRDRLPERRLLLLIPGKKGVKAILSNASHRIGFVQLFDNGVQFVKAPLVLAQLTLQVLCRLRLLNLGRCPNLLNELSLIGNGVGAGDLDGF